MPSFQSRVLEFLLRAVGVKEQINRRRELTIRGKPIDAEPPRRLYKDYRITMREVNGQKVWTTAPKAMASLEHIYYLHGGGYVNGFARQHWRFITELVDALSCTVTAPDYPRPPEHHARDVFAMVLPIYRNLIASEGAANLTVMGDSAGGGMSLALAQLAREEGLEQPANLILLSPWLDVTMTNPEIRVVDKVDPFLGVQGLIETGRIYAGDTDRTHYLVSPINGSLRRLAPITLFVGTHDILVADCRRLKEKAEAEGIALDYREFEGMVHVWMLLELPESKEAKKEITDKLKRA